MNIIKKQPIMEQKTDYSKAKTVAQTLELHSDMVIQVTLPRIFRKYLRDLSFGKEFVTKSVDGGIKITRLK